MKTGKLSLGWNLILLILPIVTAVLCLGIGRMVLAPDQVLDALFGGSVSDFAYKTVWNIRLPRILLAMLVGGGLAAAGCAFQSLFANPLATPDTLGVGHSDGMLHCGHPADFTYWRWYCGGADLAGWQQKGKWPEYHCAVRYYDGISL